MKRFLTILVILLIFLSLHGNCAALGFIGHFHSEGDGIGYFHYHPISKTGSIIDSGLPIEHHQVIRLGGTRVYRLISFRNNTIPLIPSQARGSSSFSRSTPPFRANFTYLGISSGGIPL